MNKAFIYLKSEDYDDTVFSVIIYEDPAQVLLYYKDCGISFTETFPKKEDPWRQGYSFVDYTWRKEQVSSEMPDQVYLVIDSISLNYCRWGWFYRVYLAVKFFVTRTNKDRRRNNESWPRT